MMERIDEPQWQAKVAVLPPDVQAVWAHYVAVVRTLQAAGYVPAVFDPVTATLIQPGFSIQNEAGGCTVCAVCPGVPYEAYPGYRVTLERAGYSVERVQYSNEREHWDLWRVTPTLEAAPDA